ncbi:MAG: hypothetical protein IKO12_02010 [Bacteroidaceae bacterium]|nr:hypothetical protein [Bacteroidaceae bacterium]
MTDIGILDKEYVQWMTNRVANYRQSQVKAAVKVNTEVLRFYRELGRDIVERDAKNLLERGLVEGEYPDLTISLSIARQTKQLPEYTKVKGLERDKIKQMALQFIQNAGEDGTRREFVIEYLRETLPARNTKEQNQRLVGNILAEMRNEGSVIQKDRTWYATTSKDQNND